jgi:heptaprenyl diphosphate synthase
MLILRRFIDEKHIWISSVFGALLHNTGQMAAALIITQTPQLLAYYPFLLVSGCLAGAFTGLCAQIVISRLKKTK